MCTSEFQTKISKVLNGGTHGGGQMRDNFRVVRTRIMTK